MKRSFDNSDDVGERPNKCPYLRSIQYLDTINNLAALIREQSTQIATLQEGLRTSHATIEIEERLLEEDGMFSSDEDELEMFGTDCEESEDDGDEAYYDDDYTDDDCEYSYITDDSDFEDSDEDEEPWFIENFDQYEIIDLTDD
ncbi:Hypothetical protein PHPALM_3651 [Phytophthora palmivora]|uniref:Uncharacterized protein n=1 Tax=Phytophthora palmivora TaxID=4796 RepID=A0A2P4YLW1_9STRA|nr:Hypothetical protein PHPALM_3651 [Phytophthora palmivora]